MKRLLLLVSMVLVLSGCSIGPSYGPVEEIPSQDPNFASNKPKQREKDDPAPTAKEDYSKVKEPSAYVVGEIINNKSPKIFVKSFINSQVHASKAICDHALEGAIIVYDDAPWEGRESCRETTGYMKIDQNAENLQRVVKFTDTVERASNTSLWYVTVTYQLKDRKVDVFGEPLTSNTKHKYEFVVRKHKNVWKVERVAERPF